MARFNLPPLTRSLLASLIVFTLLNIILRPQDNLVEKLEKPIMTTGDGVPYLTIVPGQSIMYPWVFLIATAVEANLMGLIITGLTIFYGGRYLERAWGSKEFTKFILFVAMIPNLLSFFLYLLGYMLSGNADTLYVPVRFDSQYEPLTSTATRLFQAALPSKPAFSCPSSSSCPSTQSPSQRASSGCASSTSPPFSCLRTQYQESS